VRHTVRRSVRTVEQAAADSRSALRGKAHTPDSGAALRAAPARPALGSTRIPHKVPEHDADSGP
jgi:hypothetical protein